ncbi:MAG: PrsW family intramembrane metalloprotease [Chloroflexi bacterium]|nr:PrsW family intramembrane metalloprotease [Chloroflexota bacterium]
MLLVGAFVVPVTFVVYFYEYVRHREISLPVLTSCFFVGGMLGLLTAGVLEFATLGNLGFGRLVGISVIEEGVKLIFPLAMYIAWQYRHEADGLLFGVAAGMGFAALETMGYALASLIQSRGEAGIFQQVLIARGLLSPAGHAAWTGLICAALWRRRLQSQRFLNLSVIGTFLIAVILHTLWNMVSLSDLKTASGLTLFFTGLASIGILSLTMVIRRFQAARRSLERVTAETTLAE